MDRKYLIVANWKMNGSKSQINSLLTDLSPKLADLQQNIECVVCPPTVFLAFVQYLIKNTNICPGVQIGAQDLTHMNIPAFTGEISPAMLREFGCNYVIIGHSERRRLLGESEDLIAAKFEVAVAAGLTPILCVGETQEQQAAGQSFEVVEQQLRAVLNKAGAEAFAKAVIAYEPVWAIGTGLTATPLQAQSMHAFIKKIMPLRVIYGGSVNSKNAADLFKEPDIDGGLIGGASLQAQDFSDICHAAMRMAE